MSPLYSACIAAARIVPSSCITTLVLYLRPSEVAKNAARVDWNSASSAKTVYSPSYDVLYSERNERGGSQYK